MHVRVTFNKIIGQEEISLVLHQHNRLQSRKIHADNVYWFYFDLSIESFKAVFCLEEIV